MAFPSVNRFITVLFPDTPYPAAATIKNRTNLIGYTISHPFILR
jgi:hypothetical protein